jgi:GxxExxY protein
VIGCCIAVHGALGPGLLETIYVRALCIEFEANSIPFEREN